MSLTINFTMFGINSFLNLIMSHEIKTMMLNVNGGRLYLVHMSRGFLELLKDLSILVIKYLISVAGSILPVFLDG
jgi:hypothetical protein